MTQKKIVVNGIMLSYVESGTNGPCIILLHGWGDSAATFQSLIHKLSKDYRLFALDLPGFGGSDSPQETWGLSNYADTVKAFVAKLKIDVYCILGHSNGGAIAIRAVGQSMLKPDKMILLASSGIRDVYKGKKRALRIAAKTAKVFTTPLPKKTKDRLKRQAYQKIGSDLFVAEHLQETFKKVVTDDVRKDAQNITLPTLLVYGSQDTATPPEFGRLLAGDITGAWLEIIEGAGHFVHHDAEARTTALIEAFLS